RVSQGEHGKPFFPDFPEIHFSLSHSGEMAMAVFADTEIGCDIELKKQANEKLARRFFCPEEYAWMARAKDEPERKERFYRLWTLKESFLKATGWGLRLPLDSFCFFITESAERESGRPGEPPVARERMNGDEAERYRRNDAVTVRQRLDQAQYDFREYRFGEYCAAICLQSSASLCKKMLLS
ncbi:MAG: 4'-phosphopantetheinyl transferase superfamily protein, partial [Lachnospiraceae bacterium]|nr:4'-phosphopantetheinyl transferase superfamily protein [Lachnospiraceae bacterium]